MSKPPFPTPSIYLFFTLFIPLWTSSKLFFIFIFKTFKNNFIYFWLHWFFGAACGLSLVWRMGAILQLQCMDFSLQGLLLLPSTGSRVSGLQQLWRQGSRAQAQKLWYMGLVPCSMWDFSGARTEPTSPALAGGFLTTGPPEKSPKLGFDIVSSFLDTYSH